MEDVKPFTSTLSFDKERGVFILKNVRLSYPKLFKPVPFQGQEGSAPRYSANFIANLSREETDRLFAWFKKLSEEKFKKQIPVDKLFARRGDDTGKPENAGAIVFAASETMDKRPMVYNRHGKLTQSDAEVYGGCMVDAIIRPWSMDNSFGKRINASLVAVKFVGDNTPFGAPPIPVADIFGVDPNQSLPDAAPADGGSSDYDYPPPQIEPSYEPDPF